MTEKNTIAVRDAAINDAILSGTAMEAFERYYADTIEMQENDATPTIGKDANRERETAFFGAITEFRGASLLETGIGENVTFSRWLYDYTHAEWGERRYHQVVVRTWRDGLVIAERFYYG
ncbi:MAG: nuclear transport factor 2 family protein [Pseudomonadota bacterium]|mgnify:FL=1